MTNHNVIKVTREKGLFFIYVNDELQRRFIPTRDEMLTSLEFLKGLYKPEEIIKAY